MKFLRYDLYIAGVDYNIIEHPQEWMEKHFTVIHSVPQSICECWWFCVEDYDEKQPLPPFLSPMKPYNLSYWRDGCYEGCKEWKETKGSCCWGGYKCVKERKCNE